MQGRGFRFLDRASRILLPPENNRLPTETTRKDSTWKPWAAFAGLVCATLALFLIPALIIQPFRFQSPRGLLLAMAVRQHAPFWTLVTGGAAGAVAFALWWHISRWKKAVVVAGLCLTVAAAAMARVDYFEWMFHPVPVAGFEAAGSSKVDAAEMVMAVNFNGEARAYPIFEMAYHHVLNDVAGGVPVAVTY
jgi:hypothetical protein